MFTALSEVIVVLFLKFWKRGLKQYDRKDEVPKRSEVNGLQCSNADT